MTSLFKRVAASRAARYWLRKLSNSLDFDPVFDILAERVAVGLRRLAKIGLSPDLVIDIGANEGQWTTAVMPIFPAAEFVVIEAQATLAEPLNKVAANSNGRVRSVMAMLGDRSAEAVPYFLMGTGSSRYEEATAFPREQVTLPMTTLDQVIQGRNYDRIFLKLDVQGAELDVLAGATNILRSTDVILLEASVVQYNAGAPRIAEVIATMDRLGFRLFDIWDLRRIDSILAQSDFVFARKGGVLESHAQTVVRNYGRSAG